MDSLTKTVILFGIMASEIKLKALSECVWLLQNVKDKWKLVF